MFKFLLISYYFVIGDYQNLVDTIGNMSIFYIKFGQWLAERPDLLNQRLIQELKRLQHNFKIHSYEDTLKVIRRDPNIDKSILYVDKLVIGSGSIAQVHRCIYDNKECVVKVKHPNIDNTLENDVKEVLYIFSWIKYFRKFSLFKPLIKYCIIDIEYIVKEIINQCDFNNESINIINYSKIVSRSPYVKVPNIYYSSKDILVIEYFKGLHMDDYFKKYPDRKEIISLRLLAHYYKSVFINNIVHGDIHCGNIIIDNDDNICLVDFGLVVDNNKKLLLNFFKYNQDPGEYLPLISLNYDSSLKYDFDINYNKKTLSNDFKDVFIKFLFKNGLILRSDFIIMLNNLDTILNYLDKDYRENFKDMIPNDNYYNFYLGIYVLFM